MYFYTGVHCGQYNNSNFCAYLCKIYTSAATFLFFPLYLIHQNSSVMQEHHAQLPVTVSHAIKWYTFSFNFASLLMPIDSYTSFKAQSPKHCKHTQTKKSSVQSCSDSLLCAGVIDLTVPEDSTRNTVASQSSTNINEPIGLH